MDWILAFADVNLAYWIAKPLYFKLIVIIYDLGYQNLE